MQYLVLIRIDGWIPFTPMNSGSQRQNSGPNRLLAQSPSGSFFVRCLAALHLKRAKANWHNTERRTKNQESRSHLRYQGHSFSRPQPRPRSPILERRILGRFFSVIVEYPQTTSYPEGRAFTSLRYEPLHLITLQHGHQ